MKKNVLVLGGYGLAGRSVVESLLAAGLWVVAAGRNRNKLLELERSLGSTPAPRVMPMWLKTCVLDVSDNSGAGIAALKHAMDEADVAINCMVAAWHEWPSMRDPLPGHSFGAGAFAAYCPSGWTGP